MWSSISFHSNCKIVRLYRINGSFMWYQMVGQIWTFFLHLIQVRFPCSLVFCSICLCQLSCVTAVLSYSGYTDFKSSEFLIVALLHSVVSQAYHITCFLIGPIIWICWGNIWNSASFAQMAQHVKKRHVMFISCHKEVSKRCAMNFTVILPNRHTYGMNNYSVYDRIHIWTNMDGKKVFHCVKGTDQNQ